MNQFGFPDYAVLVVYLVAMVVLGAWFSGRQKSLKEYFHAGGAMPWWAVGISMMATRLSPISYLAVAGWIFTKDSRYNFGGYLLMFGFIFLAAAMWLPLWGRLRVFSIYEYLERRYHGGLRSFGAVLFIVKGVFWLGTALVTASMGFESVTGFDARLCMVIIALLGTVYTVAGGMRAVIWTDVAQFAVFVIGYVAIGVVLLIAFQWQPAAIYETASAQISTKTGYPHTQLFSFELDMAVEATIWSILFIRLFEAFEFGAKQDLVQRLHAAGGRRAMYRSMVASVVCSLLFFAIVLPVSWGFVAFYANHPELATMGHTDQVVPHFVAHQLPIIMRGLLMAGVLAALMSTFDSEINSMSTVAIRDFYQRFVRGEHSQRHLVLMARLATLLFGALLLVFALWQYDHSGDTALERLGKLGNLIAAPVPAFFILGLFSKRANTGGVVCGAVAGMLFALVFSGFKGVVEPIHMKVDWIHEINWMWIGGLSLMVNLIVAWTTSFLFPPPHASQLAAATQKHDDHGREDEHESG